MKKSFISITKAFAFAIAISAIFACNSNNKGGNTGAANGGSSVSVDGIVYVHLDSLINGYDLYNDEMTKLMAKQNKYEQDLQSKGKALERRAMELQQNYEKRLITPTRAQEIQQQLATEQQKLMQTQEQQSMELADDQAQIMSRVRDSVTNYVNIYNADKRYKMIIATQGYSTVLYADPSLDITQAILNGLNDRYRGNASSAAPAAADTTKAK
ncbi:MAG: OmpH family outer membrane protein [Bacteroidales bacterium]|nr:OmpH family outer membrane protein [Bacteroidales bacterium]